MFIELWIVGAALRHEGNVYRTVDRRRPPSVEDHVLWNRLVFSDGHGPTDGGRPNSA